MSNSFDHLKLCKADADMLDQLVDVGFEVDQLEYLTLKINNEQIPF